MMHIFSYAVCHAVCHLFILFCEVFKVFDFAGMSAFLLLICSSFYGLAYILCCFHILQISVILWPFTFLMSFDGQNLFLIIVFIYFLAALGLRCCVRAFSSCSEWGLLFIVVRGLLTAVASLDAELWL